MHAVKDSNTNTAKLTKLLVHAIYESINISNEFQKFTYLIVDLELYVQITKKNNHEKY